MKSILSKIKLASKNTKLKLLLISLILGTSYNAMAMQPGAYLGGQLGYSFQNLSGSTANAGLGYDLNLGYAFNNYLGAELGYNYMHNASDGSVTSKYEDLYLAAKVAYPIGNNFDVHAKLGAAYVNNDKNTTIIDVQNLSTNNLRPYLGAGASVNVYSNVSLDLDYSYIPSNATIPAANMLGLGVSYHF